MNCVSGHKKLSKLPAQFKREPMSNALEDHCKTLKIEFQLHWSQQMSILKQCFLRQAHSHSISVEATIITIAIAFRTEGPAWLAGLGT